jgi:hypothetical protein
VKAVGILILAIAQAWLVTKWLCEMAVHYAIVKPWRRYNDRRSDAAATHYIHQCPQPPPAMLDSLIPVSDYAPEPVGNTDEGDRCWFCSHTKTDHIDAYACSWCDCEAEQYARAPVWHPGDPLPYRRINRAPDGTLTFDGQFA